MKKHLPRALALFSTVIILACAQASAATFDFSSSSQFTNNFTTFNPDNGSPGYSASTEAVTWTSGGGQTGNFVYDTNGALAGTDTFSNIVVEFDFSLSVNNSSVGIYFGGSRSSGKLALFNVNSSSATDVLRFFNGSNLTTSSSSSAGTVNSSGITSPTGSVSAGVVNFNNSTNNGWTTGTIYHAKLTINYTAETTATVTYTISDPYTAENSLTSISATATGLTVAAAGEIGFRTGLPAAGTVMIDNLQISAVPEPSTFALLGGLATLGFAISRRRR